MGNVQVKQARRAKTPRPETPTGERSLARQEQRRALEERRLAHAERLAKGDVIYKLGRTALLVAGVVLCFYFVTAAFREMAGKSTSITTLIKGAVDLNIGQYAAYAIAAVFGVGWGVERRARKKTIKDQSAHLRELESRLDPKRRSSGLLPDGTPKKEDRDA